MKTLINILTSKRSIVVLLCIAFVLGMSHTIEAKNRPTHKKRHRYLLRLTFRDNHKRKGKISEGVNIALVNSQLKMSNGISIGILGLQDSVQNGISMALANATKINNGVALSPLLIGSKKVNGLVISPGGVVNKINGAAFSYMMITQKANGVVVGGFVCAEKIKGVGISFFNQTVTSKGFFISSTGFVNWGVINSRLNYGTGNKYISGVAVGGLLSIVENVRGVLITPVNYSYKQKGVSFGVVNITKKLNGMQFGLLNYAMNNPRALRVLPFINMHIEKGKNKNKNKNKKGKYSDVPAYKK